MGIEISTYEKPFIARKGSGRQPSEETRALQEAIIASSKDGKPRALGAAANYRKIAPRARLVAKNLVTEEAPDGFTLQFGSDGEDLPFTATPVIPEKSEEPEEKIEEKKGAPRTVKK